MVRSAIPVESLATDLRESESRARRGCDRAASAFALGQFHYARGEYALAQSAFARAATNCAGADRGEARYWDGLARLALGQPRYARASFEEASSSAPDRHALARLGIAQALEAEGRAIQAFDELQRLQVGVVGEAGPAVLAASAGLADRLKRPDDAGKARTRLMIEYPASVEASRLAVIPLGTGLAHVSAGGAGVAELGAFAERARAEALAARARHAGFANATVLVRPMGPGRPALFVVRLDAYADPTAARSALDRAERALGVSGQWVER